MQDQDFNEEDLASLEKANSALWEKLDQESDLGVVLVAGAYFDYKLGECLRRYFLEGEVALKLLAPKGPLGTFVARLDCSYCLRIIDRGQYESLRKLARIRNAFAHDLHAAFSDPSVRDRVNDFADSYLSEVVRRKMNSSPKTRSTRETFIFTAFCLSMDLSHRDIDVWMHAGRYHPIIPDHLDSEIEIPTP